MTHRNHITNIPPCAKAQRDRLLRGLSATLLAVVAMLLTACSDKHEGQKGPQQTVLSIYVYTPDAPLKTRANTGIVDPTTSEGTVNSLHIWVFKHDSGDIVGCLTPTEEQINDLNRKKNDVYQMVVSDDFVQTKENVDVYIMANVSPGEYGLPDALNDNTTRDQLDQATIVKKTDDNVPPVVLSDPFGVSAPCTEVPDGGLPMTGVLKDQPVVGNAPVLRIGTKDAIATTRIVRAISKMRFVFCSSANTSGHPKITGVTLNGSMIPIKQALFLEEPYSGNNTNIQGGDYDATPSLLVSPSGATTRTDLSGLEDLPVLTDASIYTYKSQTAQEYEDIINDGVNKGDLIEKGPFYLRESDKKLSGTISYTVDGVAGEATFTMANEGDFSRNHTWIVYVCYGSPLIDQLNISVVDWVPRSESWELYNW